MSKETNIISGQILGNALVNLFGGKVAQVDINNQGFYCDIDTEKGIKQPDFENIQDEIKRIIKNDKFKISSVDIKEAQKLFQNNEYILEHLSNEELTIYQNKDYSQPGIDKAKLVLPKITRLLTISSAYWNGDEKQKQLQRIQGISFENNIELQKWEKEIKTAKENNNITLGKELDLYLISEDVGQGLPIWCPNGTMLRMQLQDFLVEEQMLQEYDFILTPHIGKENLFQKSGHLKNYKEMMYNPIDIDGTKYYLKPMNCPMHIQYYKNKKRSYRDLPLKLSEMGQVYRYEKSGELSGLMRVRGFTQDDAHIFCTPEQLSEEFTKVFNLITKVMKTLKLTDFKVRIGTRDPNSDKFIGDEEIWEKATNAIIDVIKKQNINFTVEEGEGAFYGPKADILVKDSLSREWQVGTIQVDYNLPERFGLTYIDKNNEEKQPIMIHRAALGSFERFIGIIIEHFGGAFPMWLAPKQVVIIPISAEQNEYANQIHHNLLKNKIRSKLDIRDETLGYKIRNFQKQKVPCLFILGQKEVDSKTVTIRRLDGTQETLAIDKAIENIKNEIEQRE